MTVRVALADDQPLIRAGFRMMVGYAPDLELAGEAGTGPEAVQLAVRERPEVLLMDVRMPGFDGIEATRRITAEPAAAGVRVVILTTFDVDEYVYAALRAGASGFLLKDTEPADLVRAIRSAHAGESPLSPATATRVVEELARGGRPRAADLLTPRELDVLQLIAHGRSNKRIALELGVAEKTVKTHVGHVLDKLGLSDRTQAALYAVREGLDSGS